MQELQAWGPKTDKNFASRSIFCFDLDETLTTHGRLSPRILESLTRLQQSHIFNVVVTGRPAGWADALIKLLPIDAIVAESGACIFVKDVTAPLRAPRRFFWSETGYRDAPQAEASKDPRFVKIFAEAQKRFPQIRIAADQFGRLYDFAIDFAEFVDPALSFSEADEIRGIFDGYGATAKVSSIHVNGWFGAFSKFSALDHLVEKIWKKNVARQVVYFGDSPNDASLFEKVSLSVGVRNLEDFSALSFTRPKFITLAREGDGVAEAISHFLSKK